VLTVTVDIQESLQEHNEGNIYLPPVFSAILLKVLRRKSVTTRIYAVNRGKSEKYTQKFITVVLLCL